MKVFLSELAESKLLQLNEYLLENWSEKVKNDFFKRFQEKVDQISRLPESCPQSTEFVGLFKCVVTKQNTFYYRIHYGKHEIEIITVFDSRQSPHKLENDLE
jgi:plasmid stabilization system protein ParE